MGRIDQKLIWLLALGNKSNKQNERLIATAHSHEVQNFDIGQLQKQQFQKYSVLINKKVNPVQESQLPLCREPNSPAKRSINNGAKLGI